MMMKHSNLTVTILVTLLSLPSMMFAQKEFTLEDLNFGGTNYHNMVPENRYLTWWGDELVRNDAFACYLVDKKTGKETQLFTLEEIAGMTQSSEQNRMRHLYNASFPQGDETVVALINGQERILLNWKSGEFRKYDRDKVEAEDWCAASGMMAFVKDHNLFVVDGLGNESQLSTDGSREIVYGQSVHRDEFGIEKGTFWSPDGKRLAFYRMDQSMVTDYPQVNINPCIDPCPATYEPDKYPMAGGKTHVVTIGIYDLCTQKTIYLQTPVTDVSPEALQNICYFTNIAWSPDSKSVYLFELNRGQNDCRLVSYNAETGERIAVIGSPLATGGMQELYRETSDKYVEPLHPIQFLPWDDTKFLMQSQRDGYNHLYLYNTQGECLKQLTCGPWVVMDVVGFNKKQKTIIFKANKEHPLHHRLYSVSMTGAIKQLGMVDGVHNGELSPSGNYLIDRFSTPTRPRVIDVVDLTPKTPRHTNLLEAEDPWVDYQQPIFECGSIKAADGKTDLYYRMVKPADFNPEKKYPTVVYVYGGPHANNIQASWHWASRTWETYMAQKGYIVFILDNRGSQYRGRDFEQATFHQLGQIEMQDQMKGVDYLRSLPYVDMNRLGVHGWSFGGFMTISLMTNYPDVFKVGVAGGPVIDWRWYEVMYGERYMGTPQSNPEGYAKTSLISKAKNLKGKLQIITGYNDNTVVPQHCLSFLDACVKAGTQPDFFAYPGEEHNMRGHASVHLHERITQYFEDYLK